MGFQILGAVFLGYLFTSAIGTTDPVTMGFNPWSVQRANNAECRRYDRSANFKLEAADGTILQANMLPY